MLRELIIARIVELVGANDEYQQYTDRDLVDELEDAIRADLVRQYQINE